jgi:uncharacterized YccA/Bax inhibitor family protein
VRTANPALSDRVFTGYARGAYPGEAMTIQGTVNKAALLLLLVFVAAAWVWSMRLVNPAQMAPWITVGALGGFIVALVTIFKPEWAGVTAPLYAGLEGLLLGGLSSLMELSFPGIVTQAVGLTFGTCLCMLLAYRSGLIRATEKFKLGVVSATGAIALVYFISLILGLFGVRVPYLFAAGPIGILFSLFVVTIAALNLVLDFDFIESNARAGAPRYLEWYGAFALMVTLIWLYIEILRLLALLRGRD